MGTTTEQIEWVEMDGKPGTMPDEEGLYLCAFSDGTVETFHIDNDDIHGGGWRLGACKLTHWADVPAHPNLHNWISWNENEHYGEQNEQR